MKADEIPGSIHWHEGLLLTPQHFQQSALRQEALLRYHVTMIAPFYWGISYLKIEEANVFRGQVQIKQLEAVMPDGLVVSYREGDEMQADSSLQVDLTKYDELKRKPMKVYLVVAPQSRRMSKGEHVRYDIYNGEPVADEHTGEGQVRMARLIPHLRLVIADTPPPQSVSFPVMEIEYRNDSYYQTNYIPPLLIVTTKPQSGAQSKLGLDCERIAETVREKAQELASQAETDSRSGEMRLDLDTKSWIRSLVAALPNLEAILNTEASHPYPIYLALCSMAGHLAAFGTQLIPDKPFYDHNDLRATFQPIIRFIDQAIQKGLTSSYKSYLFHYRDGIYERDFKPEWMHRRLILGMRAQPGVSTNELVSWGKECLIGSEGLLQSLRAKRIRGAERKQIEGAGELPHPKDVVLFSLNANAEFIKPEEALQIFNGSATGNAVRPVEIVLHVKEEAGVKK